MGGTKKRSEKRRGARKKEGGAVLTKRQRKGTGRIKNHNQGRSSAGGKPRRHEPARVNGKGRSGTEEKNHAVKKSQPQKSRIRRPMFRGRRPGVGRRVMAICGRVGKRIDKKSAMGPKEYPR